MPQLRITKQITKRENQSTEKYLQEVKALPLISAEEEVELAKRIKQGDEKAKEKLILANLRFVISVAKQYSTSDLSLNDLIQAGNFGLITAAERFDETRGFKFISYAVWWVNQRVKQQQQEKGRPIRIPLNRATAIHRVNKASRTLIKELEREPTEAELSEYMDVPQETIAVMNKANIKTVSMEARIGKEDSSTMQEILEDESSESPDANLMEESTKKNLSVMISKLDPRAQRIITLYFGIGNKGTNRKEYSSMTLQEIADTLDMTRERARQILQKSLLELRNMAS